MSSYASDLISLLGEIPPVEEARVRNTPTMEPEERRFSSQHPVLETSCETDTEMDLRMSQLTVLTDDDTGLPSSKVSGADISTPRYALISTSKGNRIKLRRTDAPTDDRPNVARRNTAVTFRVLLHHCAYASCDVKCLERSDMIEHLNSSHAGELSSGSLGRPLADYGFEYYNRCSNFYDAYTDPTGRCQHKNPRSRARKRRQKARTHPPISCSLQRDIPKPASVSCPISDCESGGKVFRSYGDLACHLRNSHYWTDPKTLMDAIHDIDGITQCPTCRLFHNLGDAASSLHRQGPEDH